MKKEINNEELNNVNGGCGSNSSNKTHCIYCDSTNVYVASATYNYVTYRCNDCQKEWKTKCDQ